MNNLLTTSLLRLTNNSPNFDDNPHPSWNNSYNIQNGTQSDSAPTEMESPPAIWIQIVVGTLISFAILITLTGNILVVATFLKSHNFKRFTKSLVISLSLADGLVALVVMPYGLSLFLANDTWNFGLIACRVFQCFDVMFTTTSIFHLSCLALDRYLAVCQPFIYERKINTKFIIVALCISWVIPVLISFVPILNSWNTEGLPLIMMPPPSKCIFVVNLPFALICSTIAFYLPMIFMLVCNVLIFKVAKRQARDIRRASIASDMDKVGSRKYIHREAKAAKTLSIIMGCFFFCWFPFFILNIVDPFIGYRIPKEPWLIALWLGYINSLLNPFLYFLFNRKFKEALLVMLKIRKKQDFMAENAAFLTDTTRQKMQQLYQQHNGLSPEFGIPMSRRNSGRPSVSFSIISDRSDRCDNHSVCDKSICDKSSNCDKYRSECGSDTKSVVSFSDQKHLYVH